MENSHIIIILIILVSGILGGITNFLLTYDHKLKGFENCIKFLASIAISLCASICVPLFLQVLSNNILDNINFKNGLILSGFCVLAAFFSRRYMEDLYLKVVKLENKVDVNDESTKSQLTEAATLAESVNKKVSDIEESLEQVDDNRPTEITEAIKENNKDNLNGTEIENIIKELFSPNYTYRTLNAIAKKTNIDLIKIQHVMYNLKEMGFAESKIGTNGQDFWRLLKNPIRVYSAQYGADNSFKDVTEQIKASVKSDGTYGGQAHHSFFNIPDPIVGKAKVLKIHCRIHGKEQFLTFNEGDLYTLP